MVLPWRQQGVFKLLVWSALLVSGSFQAHAQSRCLYISSYHKGYDWSDGVERGLRAGLEGVCELKQFDMDSKRRKQAAEIEQAAQQAREIIESWNPDVVITADDNAMKYIVQPHYKDHRIPFVFCGINWTVEGYDLPYRNATGMVEVAPVGIMFNHAKSILNSVHNAMYIGADTLTEKKNLSRFEKAAAIEEVALEHRLVSGTEQWLEAYEEAQDYDFVIMGSHSGINDWAGEQVSRKVRTMTRTLSLTNHEWMMPYTILGLTKIPEEQGEWAAQVVRTILDGVAPSDIPVVSNRKWEIWINDALLKQSGIHLPEPLIRKAKKLHQ
ncbi:MAG: ABC transporter substrate binding protein [Candidatus Thiodiazotropha sp.]